jgi:hypothetical protein
MAFLSDPKKVPIVATTQEHLDLVDIKDNLIVLKNGNVCVVLETSAVNFYLLSDVEQESKIYAFAGLLNSLSFYVQVLIRTENIDISRYLKHIDEYKAKQASPKIKYQIDIYRKFIKDLIVKNNVLDKHFYIIIPYLAWMPKKPSFVKQFFGKEPSISNVDNLITQAKVRLYPRRDHIMKQISRMGIHSKQLTTSELVKLFYSSYNPINAKLKGDLEEYMFPIVSS